MPEWEDDPDFDLSFHVRRMSVASPSTLREVFEYAQTDGMEPHDHGRPLWQVTLMEGLDGGNAAVLMKFHHAWLDGKASIHLALLTYESERDGDLSRPMPERPDAAPRARPSFVGQIAGTSAGLVEAASSAGRLAGRALSDPKGTVEEAIELLASGRRLLQPISAPHSSLLSGRSPRSRFDVLDIPFADLKTATKKYGFTINDGYLTGISGGLRRYHEHFDSPVEEIPMGMPISTRDQDDRGLGNQVSVSMMAAPVGITDPVARMQRFHELVLAARHESALDALSGLAGVLVHLPDSLMEGPLMNLVQIDVAAAQVPGLLEPTYLAGAQITRSYGFGPKTALAAFIGMVSHLDLCCITVHSDPAAITEPEVFMNCLRDGFEEVLALGGTSRRAQTEGPSASV